MKKLETVTLKHMYILMHRAFLVYTKLSINLMVCAFISNNKDKDIDSNINPPSICKYVGVVI